MPVNSILKTPIGIDWSLKVLDFYQFGEILDLFRGGNLLFVSTVYKHPSGVAFFLEAQPASCVVCVYPCIREPNLDDDI